MFSIRSHRFACMSIATTTFALYGCASTVPSTSTGVTSGAGATTSHTPVATASLVDPSGAARGTVEFHSSGSGLQLNVAATGLTPGFHALHVHKVGTCAPKSPDPTDPSKTGDFLSAGGHLDTNAAAHPSHAGDLPSLYADKDGKATLTAYTDRLTVPALSDPDGAAVIIHAGQDNYANIPSRYASAGPDSETKKAGDAGGRVVCGVVKKSS